MTGARPTTFADEPAVGLITRLFSEPAGVLRSFFALGMAVALGAFGSADWARSSTSMCVPSQAAVAFASGAHGTAD